ncbi:MAG: DsrE family protein [Proteobacteria bacterium]|nr:DsrE family protein [Pseudomonadota bacterium]
MQNILIIIHAAPYGSERCLSALRLATALAAREADKPCLRLFLMSDATVAGLAQQNDGAGNAIPTMLAQLAAEGVPVKLCRTCALARGLAELALLPGVEIGTLPELAQWTLEADKVVTF